MSRFALILMLLALVAVPGLALCLNKLVRHAIQEVRQTQREIDAWQARSERGAVNRRETAPESADDREEFFPAD